MRITVVDNDTSLLQSLRIILTRQGHHVECFGDAAEALRKLATDNGAKPDVLFVDFVMPGMTGLELLAKLSPILRPHCRKAIITGHAERLTRPELAAAGVDVLFPKPLDLAAVMDFLGSRASGGTTQGRIPAGRTCEAGLEEGRLR